MEQKAFTINIPSEDMVKEADYVGIVSGKTENKFETLGLTPVKSELVNAPYVDEFPFVLECKLLHILEIGRHTQFVGEILDAKVEPAVQASNNNPDPLKMKPFYFDPGTRGYYSTGKRIGDAFGIGKALKKETVKTE
jgi:flavin reductase (DIM6/NTAB) family NADH-FMN oxidoreductase RutF